MEWWKDAIVYQIYPRSFQDSNGDGIGDIPGIISRLDYLQQLGVGAVWLSPVYKSPNADNGYDISDYREINPEYGTMEDMERLISEAKKRGIRIIMDLVINHTSTEHYWFRQSRDRTSEYADYYYWQHGMADGGLPNNWTGFFGEDCWEFDAERCEYYLHLFAKSQADLNYHNPAVLEEVKDILRFWLRKGVAGFRCDVINILWKDSLENGKKKLALTGSEHYLSLEGTHAILQQLREVLDEYGAMTVGETVFVSPRQARDLCGRDRGELNMVFSFEHMECDQYFIKWFKRKFRPKVFFECLVKWQKELEWNALYLENHDQPRSIPRFGSEAYWKESGKLLATLLLTLKGTPFIYQGDEMGLANYAFTSMEQITDVEAKGYYAEHIGKEPREKVFATVLAGTREHGRVLLPWNKKMPPWHEGLRQEPKEEVLLAYRTLLRLRHGEKALVYGGFRVLCRRKNRFVYARGLGKRVYVVDCNLGSRPCRPFRLRGKWQLVYDTAETVKDMAADSGEMLWGYEARIWRRADEE